MPRGLLNWPSAEPCEPHFVTNTPAEVNFCTRWLFVSTMYALPAASSATGPGLRNWPSPLPTEPNVRSTEPSALKTVTRPRLPSLSLTQTIPAGNLYGYGGAGNAEAIHATPLGPITGISALVSRYRKERT